MEGIHRVSAGSKAGLKGNVHQKELDANLDLAVMKLSKKLGEKLL